MKLELYTQGCRLWLVKCDEGYHWWILLWFKDTFLILWIYVSISLKKKLATLFISRRRHCSMPCCWRKYNVGRKIYLLPRTSHAEALKKMHWSGWNFLTMFVGAAKPTNRPLFKAFNFSSFANVPYYTIPYHFNFATCFSASLNYWRSICSRNEVVWTIFWIMEFDQLPT